MTPVAKSVARLSAMVVVMVAEQLPRSDPITVPVIIAGVRGTAALLQPEGGEPMARAWLAMLVFFDVVFITLALWTFEPVMTE